MQKKRTLLQRFTDVCLKMEQEAGRDTLTDDEEDEAMLLLWRELYGTDNDPTPAELNDLWEEVANDFAEHALGDANDEAHAAQIVEHHKKVTH